MTDAVELDINRKNTLAFIAADPVVLVLTPRENVRVPGGGRRWVNGAPRAEQVFRLIPQGDIMPSVQGPDGVQLTPTYVLLGAHDCEMDRWDLFSFKGIDYQIVSPVRPLHSNDAYERKGDVALA